MAHDFRISVHDGRQSIVEQLGQAESDWRADQETENSSRPRGMQ